MALFPSTAIASAAAGYDVSYSCRFSEANKHYLYRTMSSAGNRRTWTISFWYKKGNSTSAHQYWFAADNNGEIYLRGTGDELGFQHIGASNQWILPKEKTRDTTGWIHFVLACDTTQGTDTERVKYYINGVRTTVTNLRAGVWGSGVFPSQNAENDVNNNVVHSIGWKTINNQTSFDGYMAEHILIDGLALEPTALGEFNAYGGWSPKDPSELTFGSNGWYLNFADANALGNDVSGNNNDFSLSGITSHDQMLDSPSNNFPTVNYLDNYWYNTAFYEGHLKITTGGGGIEPTNIATMAVNSGKWYWEVYVVAAGAGDDYAMIGVSGQQGQDANDSPGRFADGYSYYSYGSGSGNIITNNNYSSYGTATSYSAGDIISIALDLVNNKCYWAKNNSWLNSGNPAGNSNGYSISASPTSGHYFPSFGDWGAYGCTYIINFGQEGTFVGSTSAGNNQDGEGIGNFKYAPPSGFLALCAKNLPDPAVIPSENFKTILYDNGAGAKTGVGFQPDLVWVKSRGSSYEHELTDSVRGVTKALSADSTNAESTDSTGLTAFGTDGFTVGSDTNYSDTSGDGMVAWSWKAGGTGSPNTNGSINTTSTSVNAAAGFSISTYTGTGSNATVGHGLSVAPNFIVIKRRDSTSDWSAGSVQSIANSSMDFTDYINLNGIAAASDNNTIWNDTAPTASVFSIGTDASRNASSGTYVAYCWHSVEGYSKVGSYKGNNNANGTFVYCGFRPAYVMMKNITTGSTAWQISDSARDIYNVHTAWDLRTSSNLSESSLANIDFLSNGFKLRKGGSDTNSGNFLFIAFAETPLKNANAR